MVLIFFLIESGFRVYYTFSDYGSSVCLKGTCNFLYVYSVYDSEYLKREPAFLSELQSRWFRCMFKGPYFLSELSTKNLISIKSTILDPLL